MNRRAKLPLNDSAVRAADDQFYVDHPELVEDGQRIPLDPNGQVKLRQEWMKLYIANGGEVEGGPPSKKKPPWNPVEPCPDCGKGTLVIIVVDEDGNAVEGAVVTVEGLGDKVTNKDGVADYGTVEPGTYPIGADKDGYALVPGGPDSVTVNPDESTSETLVLKLALDEFSSEDSTDYPDQTAPDVKIVYLTFDDGPEPGTKEVYDLLKELGVPGTFFLVGESAASYETSVEKGFFKKLYKDGSIQTCNHSHTHAHQFYSPFYEEGLRINPVTLEPDALCPSPLRRSVLMDFEYANIAFTEILAGRTIARPTDPRYDARGKLDPAKLTGYSRFLTSRMPGSNIWRLPGIKVNEGTEWWNKTDEAEDLRVNGHKIYGWDDDFDMTFDVAEIQRKELLAGLDGLVDLYDDAYIDLDRPTETGEAVFDRIKATFDASWYTGLQKENKLILLMHERAFRRYKKGDENKYTDQLRTLITKCQQEGYKFDVLKNY